MSESIASSGSRLRIVVSGLIAQHPTLGGVAWDYLQYPLGLHRLGHDVYYIEDSGEWPYNLDGGPTGDDWVARDCGPNVHHLAQTLARFGLGDRWGYRFPLESRWFGMSDERRNEVLRTADLLINVSGTLEHPHQYAAIRRKVYLDSDPGFTQVKLALGDAAFSNRVAAHDVHFSFGEAHSPAVPPTPYVWLPTRQPVVLDEWPLWESSRDAFTTVMSWTSYRPLEYNGVIFGQKDLEFRKFLDLPRRAGPLEVALGHTEHVNWTSSNDNLAPAARDLLAGDPGMPARTLLGKMGWQVVNAGQACGALDSYRDYIRTSKAEWSVAKNGYVQAQAGWFSCRSACYLAAGRPVVVQDTGFGDVIPTGEGVMAFRNLEEAAAAIHEVRGNYARHSRAARDIADAYFRSDRVLARLIEHAFRHTGVESLEGAV